MLICRSIMTNLLAYMCNTVRTVCCGKRSVILLIIAIALHFHPGTTFHLRFPNLSHCKTRMLRFGKAQTVFNRFQVKVNLADEVMDGVMHNHPSIQLSSPNVQPGESIGIGLSNGVPISRQITKSGRPKGIDWTYEMDVELFSLHWRYKQKHHVVEEVDWTEIAEELNEPGVYGNDCLERYDFLHTEEYEKFIMYKDEMNDED